MPKRERKRSAKKNSPKLIFNRTSFQQHRKFMGLVFVVVGLLFLYKIPVVDKTIAKEPIVASSDFKKTEDSSIQRIIIAKRDIDLRVTHAKIVGSTWETSEVTASHGEGSSNPGEKGNIVVFAHAREGLFFNLKDIKKEDVIYILTRDGWYRYKVDEISSVYPNDLTTIAPTKKEILTLFTCSGFFDEKRLIVRATPTK